MLALGIVAALMSLTVAAMLVLAAMQARAVAQGAADLGALAAAQSLQAGSATPCLTGARVVAANHGSLTACEVAGEHVVLTVRAAAPAGSLGPDLVATARAHAGPPGAGR